MLNRSIAPDFIPTQSLSLPSVVKVIDNFGVQFYCLKNPNLEIFRLEIVFRAGSYFGQKFAHSYFTSKLLSAGTKGKSSNEIAESFERLGGFLEVSQNQERLVVTLHGLSKFFEQYLPDLAAIVFSPTLPLEELDIQKKIATQSYLVNIEKTVTEANKIFREGLFGTDHSFGKTLQPSEIDIVSQSEIVDFHAEFIKNTSFNVFLTGNFSDKDVDSIQSFFQQKTLVFKPSIIESPALNDVFNLKIDKPESVQSSIRLGRRMFNRHHPDFFKFLVFNTILGGFFGSRLMKNIREEKGLTYGISSSIVPLAEEGYWSIGADVKKENVPMALEEIQKEIDVLKSEKVSESELGLVKNYMKGSVLSSTNTVFDIMDKHKAILHENLPDDFYNTMLQQIDGVTADEVQQMANTYMNDLSTVVVG
ncbi:insulinase family protein [Lacihabitans sp. CCS-44]|uniref:M16 family metallopeptidase n=1 Tax=Lacihabitans sp. CCS-44 TaxID=2487331 RepID=UPI0020CC2050|nr:pitrilysin family protein [Lacihabitans sp. CCS-44]MCP9755307.1 insulinase family protein [Lacihabitans sp. CCS-44]